MLVLYGVICIETVPFFQARISLLQDEVSTVGSEVDALKV